MINSRSVEQIELLQQLARKYNITTKAAQEAISSRFDFTKRQLKTTDTIKNRFIVVRMYKFLVFYVSKKAQKKLTIKFQDDKKDKKEEDEIIIKKKYNGYRKNRFKYE